jgi:lipopolysaccharide/colanic/teichoic acid biosynthesis glycosyltransferase
MTGSIRPGLPRAFEVPMAGVALIAAAPVILLASLAIALTSGLPVMFRQSRMGRNRRPFTLVKLRTMRTGRRGPGVTARGDVRITPVGKFLRRAKLDELPELWNVLKGDMSFVGPRPEVPEYVDLADPVWQELLLARPGLTDPVTLRLRDEESLMASASVDPDRYYREVLLPEKLRGSLAYLHRRSWWSDLCILARTALVVVYPPMGRRSAAKSTPRKGSVVIEKTRDFK